MIRLHKCVTFLNLNLLIYISSAVPIEVNSSLSEDYIFYENNAFGSIPESQHGDRLSDTSTVGLKCYGVTCFQNNFNRSNEKMSEELKLNLAEGKLYTQDPLDSSHYPSIEILHRVFSTTKFHAPSHLNEQDLYRNILYDLMMKNNQSIYDDEFPEELIALLNAYNTLNRTDLFNTSDNYGPTVYVITWDTMDFVRIPLYGIIFLLGVIGNSLVIITLVQNRKMRTVTNVFLLNLAISDLLLGVLCMPFTLVGSLLKNFIFGSTMCRLIPYFQAVSISVSVWTLVSISLERQYAICHPLRSRGWQTLSHAYRVIGIVWTGSLLFMAPIAILSRLMSIGNADRHKCREVWPSPGLEKTYSIGLGLGLLLIPLFIMGSAYYSISISLWHGMKLEKQTGQGTKEYPQSLAMVQQSLRSHSRQNRRSKASKISIRFRKIPPKANICYTCSRDEDSAHYTEVMPSPQNKVTAQEDSSCNNAHHLVPTHVTCDANSTESLNHEHAYNGNTPLNETNARPYTVKRLRSTHLEKSIAAKKHVIKMLFVVVLEFFVCWTPIFVVNLLYLFYPEQVYKSLGSVGISFMHLLFYASSCSNPITYCFMNKKFLQGFKHAFGCRRSKKNDVAVSLKSQSNHHWKNNDVVQQNFETVV